MSGVREILCRTTKALWPSLLYSGFARGLERFVGKEENKHRRKPGPRRGIAVVLYRGRTSIDYWTAFGRAEFPVFAYFHKMEIVFSWSGRPD